MVFDHMVKVGNRYYEPGEDVPIGVEETSAPSETETAEAEISETPRRRGGRRKKG